MIKNKESLVKQFRSDDPSTYLSNEDQQKAMLLETIEDKKVKPKKKVMEPIEIPPIISVPRYRHSDTITTKHYTKLPESYNTGPETPVGLSQRFTQDKLREGKILKQLDQQLTKERKNSETTNKGGDTDRPV
jgi:hypothetical protein